MQTNLNSEHLSSDRGEIFHGRNLPTHSKNYGVDGSKLPHPEIGRREIFSLFKYLTFLRLINDITIAS